MTIPSALPVMSGVEPPPNILSRVAIGDFLRRAARRDPARIALVDGATRVSYGALNDRVSAAANALLAAGLQPGERVATLCNNSADFVTAFFGIHRAGLIWVPINTGLSLDDVRYILDHAQAGCVLVDEALLARAGLRELLDAAALRSRFVVEGRANGGYADFAAALEAQSTREPEIEIHDRDIAQIMYTSGTTGRPKGVMQCHMAVVMAALANAVELGLYRDDTANAMLPLFHCAQHVLLCTSLMAGATTILMRGFDPAQMLEAIERERITRLFALPLMYQAMLEHPSLAQRDLSSLRTCLYAMAPMAESLLRKLIQSFCQNFMLASGQTEMYPLTVAFRPEEQLRRFGSYRGVSSVLNDTAIMDDDGRLLGRGEVGEIVHRGPNVMQGYYRDPEATARARAFDWHHTGDLGLWDRTDSCCSRTARRT